MPTTLEAAERRRLALQTALDARKTPEERNRLGQFATPTSLAEDILRHATSLLESCETIRFLDPALGTGSFFSALLRVLPRERIVEATGFEIDPHYGEPAEQLWRDHGLTLHSSDFTRADAKPRFDLVICNPPYARHHHLPREDKERLKLRTEHASGMALSGLAGLHCYFLGLTHAWMSPGAIAGWLIPSEFMDVNYGRAVKRYLLERVTLLHVHRFAPDDEQFDDALVSSAIVWLRNEPPPPDHEVIFSFGGTLREPKLVRRVSTNTLAREPKWTRFPLSDARSHARSLTLGDLFVVKRGLATGANRFFILTEQEVEARRLPPELFTPILPGPRHLSQDRVLAKDDGSPDVEPRLLLLDTRLPEEEIRARYPALFSYLQEGREQTLHERYLCRHRSPWYAQEDRPPAPILCTYLGRRAFRFILNESRATVANVYLAMYPRPTLSRLVENDPKLLERIWQALNDLACADVTSEGRVYGGGLHKLEPRELGGLDATFLAALVPALRSEDDSAE